jgi:outer membrane protein assembly factor BamB
VDSVVRIGEHKSDPRSYFNGMARGDAPTTWSDNSNIKWKTTIPGRGFSTPVIWGEKIFLTTAIPTGKPAPAPPVKDAAQQQTPGGLGRGRGPGGDTNPQAEHKFEVLCLDRKTGKLLWQRTAKVVEPHEGYHRTYDSFASNSPVTDGKHLYQISLLLPRKAQGLLSLCQQPSCRFLGNCN